MRKFFRNFDPMYFVIVCFFLLLGFIFYSEISIERERNGFTEACITMGGVPLIGKNDTRVCFKGEAVLAN